MSRMLLIRPYRKQFAVLSIALLSFCYSIAQNPIVTENSLTGNPSSEWDITGAGDLTIQGFATAISVNKGQTVNFKIKTDAADYTIDIYRLGYYNGAGARKVGTGTVTASLPQTQPSPLTNSVTGLVDCGNWNESAHWDIPATAVSGIYIARLRRTDNGGASHIVFIVRDDASHSDMFFQASDATWQAYNVYGGNSLYAGTTSLPSGHASEVSYNRPFLTRDGGGGGGVAQDWLFNAEYPMIRFLEKNGYDLTYTTNVDAARYGNLILNHKVYLSVGHDEYWSAEQRTNVEAARNAGVHLAFFSGNDIYWKTRWQNSTDGSNTPYRTLTCYKEGTLGETVCGSKCDPSPEWTGLWRDGCAYPSAGGCNPENALTGQIGWQNYVSSIKVPDTYKDLRFWRNTSVASLGTGETATFPNGTLGHEWEFEQYTNSYPSGRITLSSTSISGHTHKLSLYRHASGALVFGAGTVQWSWGLDNMHDNGNDPVSQDMQQATVNLFADMGVQPGTLQAELTQASASTDHQAPVSVIASPVNGVSIPSFSPITITGTTTDGNVLVGVEISVDGGLTWKLADGTANWTYTWTPSVQGPVTIKVRGFDDSGNMEVPGAVASPNAITINVTPPQCPCSLFEFTDVPTVTNKYDNVTGIEVGVKFFAKADGFISGVRFYKSSEDVGTHVGTLWTRDGTFLAQAEFTNETGSGWQEALFESPVAISANTTYVASYYSPTGYYSESIPYFSNDITKGPLTAIAMTHPDGPNGVYIYSPSTVFPSNSFQSNNYWVDVVYVNSPVDVVAPTIKSTFPANNTSYISVNTSLNIVFNEAIDPSTINNATIELRNSANTLLPSTVSYNAGLYKATLTPNAPMSYSSLYSITVIGGTSGVKDLAGTPLASDLSTTFRTSAEPLTQINEGPGGPILVISTSTNPFSRYPVEILRAEGLNEFGTSDITAVTAAVLNNYDVVILGEMTVTAPQVNLLTNWVNAGGTLIAFKPSSLLTPLLGISNSVGTLSNKYLLVNTASGPGAGIVDQTIQFHGTADLHNLAGATSLATLYSNATTATTNPAVTTINVGANGGKAVAFTYDLGKSIVYTRQGNPAWAGQKRDGQSDPIRSDDMFFGLPANTGADWIDLNKVAIPQADEQQRLLANIILQSNLHRKPLPRFWYLPRELKAAIVMTGDDHGVNGTVGRFDQYLTLGPNTPQDVLDWKAIRGTSYIYPNTPITDEEIVAFQNHGFEIALHPTTGCTNFTAATLDADFESQLEELATNFPGILAPVSNRTHCMPWSDWATHPKTEYNHGIRLDVNYYYWPGSWVQNRPGMFTGSGMPMRFADTDGSLIDCYQAPTQMTDESDITVGSFCDALLDKAIGAEGYYGVFVANMHTDTADHMGSNAVIASALARDVPVISAKQMLEWLDGRNNSSFGSIAWSGNTLSFTITAAAGSHNLRAMLPYHSVTNVLTQLTRNGSSMSFTVATIKGIEYAFFDASVTGSYTAMYGSSSSTITGQVTLQGRPAAPNAQWQVPVQVQLYIPGSPTPVETFTATTDVNGQFVITGVPVGTYNIKIKNSHTLARMKMEHVILNGNNNIDFGTLLEGDANDDNAVDVLDFSLLLNSFYNSIGDAGYDQRTDFNGDGTVDVFDFSLLLNSFYQYGEDNE